MGALEDGRYLLYAIQDGGTDWRTAKVLDVATGKETGDSVHGMKFTLSAVWAKDGSGFYLSALSGRRRRCQIPVRSTRTTRSYFYKLGTPDSADTLVFETPDSSRGGATTPRSPMTGAGWRSPRSEGTDDRYQITLIDLKDPRRTPRVIVPGLENS